MTLASCAPSPYTTRRTSLSSDGSRAPASTPTCSNPARSAAATRFTASTDQRAEWGELQQYEPMSVELLCRWRVLQYGLQWPQPAVGAPGPARNVLDRERGTDTHAVGADGHSADAGGHRRVRVATRRPQDVSTGDPTEVIAIERLPGVIPRFARRRARAARRQLSL